MVNTGAILTIIGVGFLAGETKNATRDGLFFSFLAKTHPRWKTPTNAILLPSAWALIILFFWGTFENVITYVVFTDWIFFCLAAVVVIIFRSKRNSDYRPYKTLGYPVTPLIFIIITAGFVVNTFIEKPDQAYAGLWMISSKMSG